MILMGVDPGTRYAGYAIIKYEKQKTVLMDYGYLNMSKKKNIAEKIGILYDFFTEKAQKFHTTHLIIETPFLFKNASTFLKLGYVRGILYLIANKKNIKILEYSPCEVKQAVTGYGKASKEQVSNMINKFFRIKCPQRNDVTDAIAIALCGLWKAEI